ncbi:hypothetical protein AC1031_013754 [Aphanomyces cochlioides]|nr:hypothetical protein AC1031_013754 [Aphanomyces cochlioides]
MLLVNYLVSSLDSLGPSPSPSMFKGVDMKMAVEWMKSAWADVSTTTISNCFKHCKVLDPSRYVASVCDPSTVTISSGDVDVALANEECIDESLSNATSLDNHSDENQVRVMLQLLGCDPEDIILDEDIPPFETDAASWERDVLEAQDAVDSADDADSASDDDNPQVPRIVDVQQAVALLETWAKHSKIDIARDISSLRSAIAVYRSKLPNGTIESWLL